jgi:hypothetical protein
MKPQIDADERSSFEMPPNAPQRTQTPPPNTRFAKRTHRGTFGCIRVHPPRLRFTPVNTSRHQWMPVNVIIDLAKRTHRSAARKRENEPTVEKPLTTASAGTTYNRPPRRITFPSFPSIPFSTPAQQLRAPCACFLGRPPHCSTSAQPIPPQRKIFAVARALHYLTRVPTVDPRSGRRSWFPGQSVSRSSVP